MGSVEAVSALISKCFAATAVALVLGTFLDATSGADAQTTPNSQPLCHAVASRIWSDAARLLPDKQLAIDALSVSGGYVQYGATGDSEITGVGRTLTDVLEREYHAPADLLRRVHDVGVHDTMRIGNSNVWMLDSVSGTAYCHSLVSLVLSVGHPAHETHSTIASGVGAFCGMSVVSGVNVGGIPALWVESDGNFSPSFANSQITLTPVVGDDFQPPCSISVKYAMFFKAKQAFCDHDVDCVAVIEAAETLATRRDAGDGADQLSASALPFESPPVRADFGNLQAAAARESPPLKLPTFGNPLVFGPYDVFLNPVDVPMRINGSVYLARIGHGRFGWRETADYLVGLYKGGEGGLIPVAGVYVQATRSRVVSVSVK